MKIFFIYLNFFDYLTIDLAIGYRLSCICRLG